MIDWIFAKLDKFPSTNARIAVTIVIWVMVACRAMFSVWEPSLELLGTIVTMSALDVGQFAAKRRTTHKPEEIARAAVIQNGHTVADESEMG